jgi:hypothetical protein
MYESYRLGVLEGQLTLLDAKTGKRKRGAKKRE